jgi:hypothetical protein
VNVSACEPNKPQPPQQVLAVTGGNKTLEYWLRALIPLPPKIRVLEPICMMQIPEPGDSGAEMYGTKLPNIDLPVPKF